MFSNFRLSMAWAHTWFGLVLGFVLMECFFFGALSVFDQEIDRWAIPVTRFSRQHIPSFDQRLRPTLEALQPGRESLQALRSQAVTPPPQHFDVVRNWSVSATHRDPMLDVYATWEVPGAMNAGDDAWVSCSLDPRTGAALPDDRLRIGSRFFYPMHYGLHLEWKGLGYWIAGLAALVMLVTLVSGVILHRRIFREFFTFRPKKAMQRSVLDLHNLTGVLAVPFHFFFAFTGLMIFAGIYFPIAETQLKPLHDQYEQFEAQQTSLPRQRAGVAAPLASVDAMVVQARHRWAARGVGGEVGLLELRHVGDVNGTVSVFRASTDRVALVGEGIHFKASTGELLYEDPPRTAVDSVHTFLTGLHLAPFRHWLLRWLYLLGGLMGCACIATGFIFFVGKRKRQHAKVDRLGVCAVDALAVTTVTGMLIATLAILIANRLLPDALPVGWPLRSQLEIGAFWGSWTLAMLHAFMRSAPVAQGRTNPAWREQCWAVGGMAITTVLLNWVTTGDHLIRTVSDGYWPVAGVDLFLLASAALALMAARKLKTKPEPQTMDATRSKRAEAANA
ncbi:MAG: PepSY-associated TM helix domain-containing protein [Burkholderiaceae bacterium]